MQDTKTLAQALGLSEKTIRTRAAALGLVPEQVSQGAGRPKALWSGEQAQAIAAYGQTQDSSPNEALGDVEGNAAQAGYLALQQTVSMPMGQQLAALNQTYEALEDQAAIAIAHRTAQVLPRAMAKASALLTQRGTSFDFADLAKGALGVSSMQAKPIAQSLTSAQLSSYLDNF
jgi:hypothetical protein